MNKIRVKDIQGAERMQHKEIKAARGIKISAQVTGTQQYIMQGLEHAIAGTSICVVGGDYDVEDLGAVMTHE
ncbi:hypothetical protein V6N13_122113 [Hibiscus sabdariffa]